MPQPRMPGSKKYRRRDSDVFVSNGSTLKVTQTSLSKRELVGLLSSFGTKPVRFVTQIVEGSTVSLTISPTRAADD